MNLANIQTIDAKLLYISYFIVELLILQRYN